VRQVSEEKVKKRNQVLVETAPLKEYSSPRFFVLNLEHEPSLAAAAFTSDHRFFFVSISLKQVIIIILHSSTNKPPFHMNKSILTTKKKVTRTLTSMLNLTYCTYSVQEAELDFTSHGARCAIAVSQ
jgi:hypothetical protein